MILARKKFLLFAVAACAMATLGVLIVVLGADLYLHHRARRSAGLNRWGYRGPVAGRKQTGETRIVMLGGSTAFGYGVTWSESIPASLEQALRRQHPDRTWTVVNLAYNSEGAYAFRPNLEDVAYLDYDLVILYEGYNDLLGDLEPNLVTVRRRSPVFRATGYFPILPLWLDEKAQALRGGRQVDGETATPGEAKKTVFKPGLAARASASALDAAQSVGNALANQFEPSNIPAATAGTEHGSGCAEPWAQYCESERRAIDFAIARRKRVLVVGQPQLTIEAMRGRHDQQQEALSAMLRREYGSNPLVQYVRIGQAVDLGDPNVTFDQMHLNADGNQMVAAALVDPVVRLLSAQ